MAEVNGRYEAEVPVPPLEGEIVSDNVTEADPSAPGFITPKARTVLYIASLIVTVVTGLVLGIAVILGWITEDQATRIGTLVYGAVALVNTSLAVGFRPTRPAVAAK
jgi:hypothetical protein